MNGSAPSFVDEKLGFKVEPAYVEIPRPPAPAPEELKPEPGIEEKLPTGEFTEEELMFLTESIVSLPLIVWDKMSPPDPKKLERFNHEFYRYCIRRGIDPWSYFWDELPMALAGISLSKNMWDNYQEKYGKKKKEEQEREKEKEKEKIAG